MTIIVISLVVIATMMVVRFLAASLYLWWLSKCVGRILEQQEVIFKMTEVEVESADR